MEAIVGETAKYALNKSLKAIKAYMEETQKYSELDAKRCQAYLFAASAAVKGLMSEPEEIVSQARLIDLDKTEDVEKLVKRINAYLYENRIRRHLYDVMGGLAAFRYGLQHAADRKLLLPHVKKNRKEAIADYCNLLLRIEMNLNELNQNLLSRESGVSGLGANNLLGIFSLLRSGGSKDYIKEQMEPHLSGASVEISDVSHRWYELLQEINMNIERLNIEFLRPK